MLKSVSGMEKLEQNKERRRNIFLSLEELLENSFLYGGYRDILEMWKYALVDRQ